MAAAGSDLKRPPPGLGTPRPLKFVRCGASCRALSRWWRPFRSGCPGCRRRSCRPARSAGQAAVPATRGLLDQEKRACVEEQRGRAHVAELTARPASVAVDPHMRDAVRVADRVGDGVVAGVRDGVQPGLRQRDQLADAGGRIPLLYRGVAGLSEVQPAARARPGGHRAGRLGVGEGPVLRPADLELRAAAGKCLDQGEVRAVGREAEEGVVLGAVDSPARHRSERGHGPVAAAGQQVQVHRARVRGHVCDSALVGTPRMKAVHEQPALPVGHHGGHAGEHV